MRVPWVGLMVLIAGSNIPAQSTIEKIRSLNLDRIEGDIEAFHSEGFQERAEETVRLLQASVAFFEGTFGVRESFSIALIDSATWAEVTKIPYGLPFVSGPPYVVCIPADSQNDLSRVITSAIEGHSLNERYELPNADLVKLFVSLIGFHELGHIYSKTYGLRFPNKWTNEFAATFFAYSYLEKHFPRERDIWIDVSRLLADKITPEFASLTDFEEKYVRVGVENYAWYQVVFLLRVEEVYESRGIDFLNLLKEHSFSSPSTSHYVEEMDKIDSGFMNWAGAFQLLGERVYP